MALNIFRLTMNKRAMYLSSKVIELVMFPLMTHYIIKLKSEPNSIIEAEVNTNIVNKK